MRPPEKDNAQQELGGVGKTKNRQVDHNGTAHSLQSLCVCRAGRVCGSCHIQNRIAETIHDSLRRQALGNLAEG